IGTTHAPRRLIVQRSAISQLPGSSGTGRKWRPSTSAPSCAPSRNAVASSARHSGRSAVGTSNARRRPSDEWTARDRLTGTPPARVRRAPVASRSDQRAPSVSLPQPVHRGQHVRTTYEPPLELVLARIIHDDEPGEQCQQTLSRKKEQREARDEQYRAEQV